MTKNEFKENCNFQVYTSRGTRINAIFYDWKTGEIGGTFQNCVEFWQRFVDNGYEF